MESAITSVINTVVNMILIMLFNFVSGNYHHIHLNNTYVYTDFIQHMRCGSHSRSFTGTGSKSSKEA